MGTKMKKGILKPFRYISNIMVDGKEPEMQIGFPTDVKHVAHIGWDGPSTTTSNAAAPTWMKDYHSAPLDSASFRGEAGGAAAASNPWASQEIVFDGGSSLGDTSFRGATSEAGGIDVAGGDSPPSPVTRRARRHRSRATSSMDGTPSEASGKEKSKKGIRKNRKKGKDEASAGDDGSSATCQDLPAVPKKSNRRKKQGKDSAEAVAEAAPLASVAED